MKGNHALERAHELAIPFRVTKGGGFRLKDIDPGDTLWLKNEDKAKAKEALASGMVTMSALQEKLYAQSKWSMLLIFQAMDAAGKDGAIKHVMSGLNPQGCQVHSFKAPSNEDLDHDYLWRCLKVLPNRGMIGIFNRSYYEEVLVVRVHPEMLDKQRIPRELISKHIWKQRFEDIRNLEQHLSRNGVVVLKFFLHISKKEQKRRFLERLETPDKNWKFSPSDLHEREHWDEYMDAYEDMIRHTATKEAPWHVVPADNKWFTRVVVSAAIVEAMGKLKLAFPEVDETTRRQLALDRAKLMKK
jgi:PPK2 family polyphosphate:nucleotide phosphotransferase